MYVFICISLFNENRCHTKIRLRWYWRRLAYYVRTVLLLFIKRWWFYFCYCYRQNSSKCYFFLQLIIYFVWAQMFLLDYFVSFSFHKNDRKKINRCDTKIASAKLNWWYKVHKLEQHKHCTMYINTKYRIYV